MPSSTSDFWSIESLYTPDKVYDPKTCSRNRRKYNHTVCRFNQNLKYYIANVTNSNRIVCWFACTRKYVILRQTQRRLVTRSIVVRWSTFVRRQKKKKLRTRRKEARRIKLCRPPTRARARIIIIVTVAKRFAGLRVWSRKTLYVTYAIIILLSLYEYVRPRIRRRERVRSRRSLATLRLPCAIIIFRAVVASRTYIIRTACTKHNKSHRPRGRCRPVRPAHCHPSYGQNDFRRT